MNRFAGRKGMYCNSDMQSKDIQTYCKPDAAGEDWLKMAITKLGLSARAYDRIVKPSSTEVLIGISGPLRNHLGGMQGVVVQVSRMPNGGKQIIRSVY